MDAIRENRLAVELDPGLSDTELGSLMFHVGLYDEWEKTNQRAIELDPTNQRMKAHLFVNEFYLINRPEDALATQRRLFPQEQACRWRIPNRAKRRLNEPVTPVVHLGPNTYCRQVSVWDRESPRAQSASSRDSGAGSSQRRARVMPRSASGTAHDSGPASDTH